MWILVTGNPIDGLTLKGPFATAEDASEWAEKEDGSDWWITELHPADEAVASRVLEALSRA